MQVNARWELFALSVPALRQLQLLLQQYQPLSDTRLTRGMLICKLR